MMVQRWHDLGIGSYIYRSPSAVNKPKNYLPEVSAFEFLEVVNDRIA